MFVVQICDCGASADFGNAGVLEFISAYGKWCFFNSNCSFEPSFSWGGEDMSRCYSKVNRSLFYWAGLVEHIAWWDAVFKIESAQKGKCEGADGAKRNSKPRSSTLDLIFVESGGECGGQFLIFSFEQIKRRSNASLAAR